MVSNEYLLSENFEPYEFEFDIDQYYDTYKLQVMVGKNIGNYYFDDFQTTFQKLTLLYIVLKMI